MIRLDKLWHLSRFKKRLISLVVDTVFIVFAFYAAYWTRIGSFQNYESSLAINVLVGTIFVTLIAYSRLGLYRAVLRFLTFHALAVVFSGASISAASISILAFHFDAGIPRSVPVIYGAFLCLLCGGSRLTIRILLTYSNHKGKRCVLIYGAGSAGRQLALALRTSDTHRVVGFIDEDLTIQNTMIMGLPVKKISKASVIIHKYDVRQILLAIPSASRAKRREILESLVGLSAEVLTVPDMKDIVEGRAKIDELKDVDSADLLGRDPVIPQKPLMEANTKNKVVLVTGAGGSIGSELCRQIILHKPQMLIMFEISEFALYQIEREIRQLSSRLEDSIEIVPLMGSVQNQNRLFSLMTSFDVDTVYHAAAYKHVPLVEHNVVEGVRNNVFGTYFAAKAAIEAGVSSFVLISTDKAVRPTNIMGATKRLAELGLQALSCKNNRKVHNTKFCMVRFGNVLGSSGSVIPLFKKQIAQGGPITVTHPDIIRYFMTIPEAAQLVIQSGAMAKGGDVFVLDMGQPVKIVDLAKNLIQLSGLEVRSESKPYGDIAIEYTGLRPGEKLFEELLIGDNVATTDHDRIMSANERYLSNDDYSKLLDSLDAACQDYQHDKIRQLLMEAPTGFNPTDGIGDLVWNQKTKISLG